MVIPLKPSPKLTAEGGITIKKAGHAHSDLGDASNCVHSYVPRSTSYGRGLDSLDRNQELCAFYYG
jgi:hypothetical protein